MADEIVNSTDLNMATGGVEDSEVVVSTKGSEMKYIIYKYFTLNYLDQPMIQTVDENGYESECSSSSRSEADIARSALEVEADAFTRFIERQRTEVMFELRNLRLGDRPVTGQPNRERIESFLNDIQESQQVVRAPSTRPPVPSAHMADINALTSRRCVSAALGSAAFRQDLENTIRQSMGGPPVQQVRTPVVVQQQRPPITPAALLTAAQQLRSNVTRTIPTPPIQQQLPRPTQAIPPAPVLQTPLNIQRQERELDAWHTITQLQRETIVVEISDLVHRQLVTSALESDFRQHLEHNVLSRLEQGTTVQHEGQTVRPLPPVLPQPTRVSSTISTTNVDALTSRLDSMQQMMQLMFKMQMDMQRSLRQEVASALAQNAAATTTTMNSSTQPMIAGHCTICLTATADTVLYRCGHLCVCYMCGLQLQETAAPTGVKCKCPVCRAPVDDILRVYRSSRDGE
ncbi:unnamed protein product [Adineta steineri]|uniref:RING-type domain-containing protein n=1 Tax=Adineta steineri TaxID=433720 RepID=A0A813UTG5_9BILA|nr:unnamed protein product [Adineta steineri]CAF1070407.1 unnamed protein product [Adineta steineri]